MAPRPVDRPFTTPAPGAPAIGRRQLLLTGVSGLGVAAFGGLVAACGGGGSNTVQEGVSNGPEISLTAIFPRDTPLIAANAPTRLPYTLSDAEGIPASSIAGPLTFTVSLDGAQVGDPVEVPVHSDGVPRPYLPLHFTFPEPGLYDIGSSHDGSTLTSQVQVFDPADIAQPVVGDALPSVNTPTTANSLGVDPMCTSVPTCPFHEHDLAVALEGDLPVVVLLATPAYCRTTACGPILDLLIEEAGRRDDIVVIHSEVYKDPKLVRDLQDATLAPLPTEFNMPFEPCLFVTNASHTLVARGDVVVDRVEMAQMLELAV